MIDLNDVLVMWAEDCQINNQKLDETSKNTPTLHAKYLRMLSESKLMLKKAIKYAFCQNIHNIAFRSISRNQPTPVFSEELPKEKLDALADAIKSLSNIELQYLFELQNADALANN